MPASSLMSLNKTIMSLISSSKRTHLFCCLSASFWMDLRSSSASADGRSVGREVDEMEGLEGPAGG